MASLLPSPPCLKSRNVEIFSVSVSSSSSSSPVSSRLPLCCVRVDSGACSISRRRSSSSCLLVASSSSRFLSNVLINHRGGLISEKDLCERFRARGRRIVEAKSEVSPPDCDYPLTGGFVAGVAAAVLSRTVLFAAIISEALVRAARSFGQTLTATKLPEVKTLEERTLVAALKGRLVVAATAPLFFAAISQPGSVSTPLTVVASGMAKWLELYSGVLMVRVLLSWFPNIPWERQPLQAIRDMCDPYLNLFRNIIPPLFNALDLSPMLAFMVLGILTSILNTTVQG